MMCSGLACDKRRKCDSHLCVNAVCFQVLYGIIAALWGKRRHKQLQHADGTPASLYLNQQVAVSHKTSPLRGECIKTDAFYLDRCHYSLSPVTRWENIPSKPPATVWIPHIFTFSLSYFTSSLSSSPSFLLCLVLPLCSSHLIMASSLAVVLLIGANGRRRPGWVGVCDSFRQAGSKLCKRPLVIHDSVQHPRASINPGIGAFFLSVTHLPLFSSHCFVISLHLHLYSPLLPASSPVNSFSLGLSTVVHTANHRQTEGQLVYTTRLMYADE